MAIPFTKMSGAGNDFIVVDNRADTFPAADRHALIARMCARRTGIGADGVLLLEQPRTPKTDFAMRYYNADGGEADMCGNGGRCIALFAHRLGAAGTGMAFTSPAGTYRAEVLGGGTAVRLEMTDPREVVTAFGLETGGTVLDAGSADTGVPHVVIWTDDAEGADVIGTGRTVRRHPRFAPAGTNVNFVQVTDRSHLVIRTYERGVEDETLACGTGTVAAAVLTALRGGADLPVAVTTRGGDVLTVHGQVRDGRVTGIRLEGPAVTVYTGIFTD